LGRAARDEGKLVIALVSAMTVSREDIEDMPRGMLSIWLAVVWLAWVRKEEREGTEKASAS
jgi:hypothetical protein